MLLVDKLLKRAIWKFCVYASVLPTDVKLFFHGNFYNIYDWKRLRWVYQYPAVNNQTAGNRGNFVYLNAAADIFGKNDWFLFAAVTIAYKEFEHM